MKLRTAGAVLWMLRWDLLAVLVVAGIMMWLSDKVPYASVAQIVPLMGVVVSIFIGFRNSSAYNRWWEARTLWGTMIGNSRSIANALVAVDNCTESMAEVIDRMRRRQVRYAWELAAELRGVPAGPGVAALTPEDRADATSRELLTAQSVEIRDMANKDWIDRQGRTLLVNQMTAQSAAAGGLERIRNQPIPWPYAAFIRTVAWFFAIMVCTRLDVAGHDSGIGVLVSILVMAMFVVAERIGSFLEKPMTPGPFGLTMDRFCTVIQNELLGPPDKLPAGKATSGALVQEK
ncbi:MAG: bestrophin family ion channel [Mycobacterium sp.]